MLNAITLGIGNTKPLRFIHVTNAAFNAPTMWLLQTVLEKPQNIVDQYCDFVIYIDYWYQFTVYGKEM